MTTSRAIQGLSFLVHSPSLYELQARDDGSDIALVSIAYVPHAWYVDILMKAGHSHHRGPFRSRDAAIALIAGRAAPVEYQA